MTEQPASIPADVPSWDLADRMRKALRHAALTPGQMAAYLGVGGNTVSTWINGRIEPSTQTVRLWALRCGVAYEWICHGDLRPCIRDASRGQTRSNSMQSNRTLTSVQMVAA